jgi:hypothetical protein
MFLVFLSAERADFRAFRAGVVEHLFWRETGLLKPVSIDPLLIFCTVHPHALRGIGRRSEVPVAFTSDRKLADVNRSDGDR